MPRSVNWKRCNRETYKIQAILERLIVLWPTRSQGRSRIYINVLAARYAPLTSTSGADKQRYRHDVCADKENTRPTTLYG